ncbi:MAG: hypothetical protein ABJF04_05285 [Reichenbachiella sp.]|uniref:hypothetical protein n=1 Tax=Reichenbachiella sp. TaxID=2184521 RepID=UPI0032667E73
MSVKINAQNKVFAFYEYDIKDGMTDQFVNGYAKDLEWHKSQKDDWSWLGWFVTNGKRRGRFIDATPDHAWTDFDRWKVDRAENVRHNKIHWVPYVENYSGSYNVMIDEYSAPKPNWLTSAFLQVYSLKVKIGRDGVFKKFLSDFKVLANRKELPFVWMQTVSGGGVSEYQLFVGISRVEELGKCMDLFDFSMAKSDIIQNYSNAVESNTSELWRYSSQLTLLVE